MNILMFGAPGSGKGTQGALLSDHFQIKHISFGDVLRKHIKDETSIGKNVRDILANGQLVGIDIMQSILVDELNLAKSLSGAILDGFPRSIEQAMLLDKILIERNDKIDAIVHMVISDDVIRSRLSHRAKIQGRLDDQSTEKINNRITIYKAETKKVLDFYEGRLDIYTIDAEKNVEEILSYTKELLKNYK